MIKASDLFKSASEEELAKRQAAYPAIRLQDKLDKVKKSKLADGTWMIYGELNISYCNLTTLKNLNITGVDEGFDCSFNKLTTLEGAPIVVNGDFACDYNDLTSLEGSPREVKGSFYCDHNLLTSLNGGPKSVRRDYNCYLNKTRFTEAEVRAACHVKGQISI